jgi:hypothetical protein
MKSSQKHKKKKKKKKEEEEKSESCQEKSTYFPRSSGKEKNPKATKSNK